MIKSNCWRANPLIPNQLTSEVENLDWFRGMWHNHSKLSHPITSCHPLVEATTTSCLDDCGSFLPSLSASIPSPVYSPVDPSWPLKNISQIVLIPYWKISISFPLLMDWSQTPYCGLKYLDGLAPAYLSEIMFVTWLPLHSLFIVSHKPRARSCLRLWTCCSLSGRSVLSSDFQRLLHWGLSPSVTFSEWPLLIPLSPPAPLHLSLCSIFCRTHCYLKLHSIFIIVCLTHSNVNRIEGQNLKLFTTIFSGPRTQPGS